MTIDRFQLEDLPPTNEVALSQKPDLPSVVYNQVDPFLRVGTPEYCRRMNDSLDHRLVKIGLKMGAQVRCSLCCKNCDSEKRECKVEAYWIAKAQDPTYNGRPATQLGRKTTKMCLACNIVLCKYCFQTFHSDKVTLPQCRSTDLVSTMPQRSTRSQQASDSTPSALVEPPIVIRRNVTSSLLPNNLLSPHGTKAQQ